MGDVLAIETRGLSKSFGSLLAVDGLDLAIPRGVFYGLLGPNGAGKSTTLALLAGLLRPTAGAIRLAGRDLDPDDPATRRSMGVAMENPPLFARLSGLEQLLFVGRMFGLARGDAEERADDLLRLFDLQRSARALVTDYSRGMRKKLALSCALIHGPELLLFDEPFEGVDALSAEVIRRVLGGLVGKGATVLLTTHILEVAERLCQRIGIIHRGRLCREIDGAELEGGARLADLFREAVGAKPAEIELPKWLGSLSYPRTK